MDDLKDKFKGLLSKASNQASALGKKKFSGQGHRLGTAEEHGVRPKVQGQGVLSSQAAASSSTAKPASRASQQPGQYSRQQTPAEPAACHELKPATEFSPFTAVIGSGAALSAHSSAPDPSVAPPTPAVARNSVHRSPIAASSGNSSSEVQHAQVPVAAVPAEAVEQLQHCLALIMSQPAAAAASMEVLIKLLSNLAAASHEAKYRQIRLSNAKIRQTVVDVAGALEFLAAVGFEVHAADTAASSSNPAGGDNDGGFAVFLDDKYLSYVQEGLLQLQQALPAALETQQVQQQQQQQQQQQPTSLVGAPKLKLVDSSTAGATASTSSVTPAAVAPAAAAAAAALPAARPTVSIARDTQVLLPAAPDTNVPDWFFERTGAEVKAEYMSMLRARQTGELFASRAWKDARLGKAGQGPTPTVATIRVRFPEGVCLQGCFHVSEPLTALFEWVTDSLREAGITYELVQPDRRPLASSGCVRDADLAPAVLLNFRPLGHQEQQLRDSSGRQQPFLRDELLLQAKAD